MAQILKLKTYHCTASSSDKVYGVVVTRSANGFYNLITFYGPRGKTLNVRCEKSSVSSGGMYDKFSDICRTRERHGYDEVDWQNPKFGMRDTVLALGTPPGMSSAPEPVPTQVPPVAPPSRKPVAPKSTTQPRLGRSLEQRDF